MRPLARQKPDDWGEITRRNAMRLSGNSVLGLSLQQALQARIAVADSEGSEASAAAPGFGRAKSVIMLWLLGGLSQVESWDPKPGAPKEVRGEFGRTPRFNKNAGRDHWGSCFSIAMARGGIRGGITHGESDGQAASPVAGVVTPADLMATIFHCLGIQSDTIVHEQTGKPIPISRGEVIYDLL